MIWGQSIYWYWLAGGVLISVFEIFLPGVIFLWLGIGAMITGLIVLAAPDMAVSYQFLVFAALALGSVAAGRRFVKSREAPTDHPDLNRRGVQYVGRIFTLDTPTSGGRGRMRVDDTTWAVAVPSGGDLPAGRRVRVTDVDGIVLVIEPADSAGA